MGTIAVTTGKIGVCFPAQAEIYSVVLAATVTKGAVLYQTTSGTYGLCDIGAAATDEPRGIALEAGVAGQAISMIIRGAIYGVTLTGTAYDGLLYASDTAGEISDAAVAEIIGRCIALTDPDLTKVLFVDIQSQDWN